ncbi:hydroxyneurosporene methyltransferase [Actinomadura darangshiensis]|uniref:Hydroxyneurosporene methyltransferase n=1 Tax=Actinomadura darangshiensis TaxID=705336 RepID=A0A4R5BNU2_9ACTN|nr:methyltransferase [Actinomadura darangshiensis]TDD85584.1 hydroxyneurosporene methyltransferase [Actinomadura darangshiensis]
MALPDASISSQPPLMVASGDSRAAVWKMVQGVYRFSALYTMARLDLAGRLNEGPRTPAELATSCGARQDQLTRLLRALAAMGFLEAVGDAYALTGQGATLYSDIPGSMRWAVLSAGEPGSWNAMTGVTEAVRTGVSPFAERYGSMYGYLEHNPEAGHDFDAFMVSRSKDAAAALTRQYEFSGIRTVTDVGGGVGLVLSTLMDAYPEVQGTVLDLKEVAQRAEQFLADRGLTDRCRFVAGDYFDSVPEGSDLYLLANIVHNHGREDAVRVLRQVRAAMRPDSRLLALDVLLPGECRPHFGFDLDIRMMAVFSGGRERDQDEYTALLDEAGLRVTRVEALHPTPLSMIEAVATQ